MGNRGHGFTFKLRCHYNIKKPIKGDRNYEDKTNFHQTKATEVIKSWYLQNPGYQKKKHEKSHFMLIFRESLVSSLQKQGRFSLFVPFGKKRLNFAST